MRVRVLSFAQEKEKIRGGHTQWWIQEWSFKMA
jgi:hypothetical protein